jgi:5S rRNA maturation endonuclease (ribonuclease M5)
MHSLSSSKETISFLKQNQYEHILLFLDNDEPGKKTTAQFIEALGQSIKPQNEIYFPYKDVNAMLCKK